MKTLHQRTIGTEIENERDGGGSLPFQIGGYHSGGSNVNWPLLPDWRAERDGSLGSGGTEVISPPLPYNREGIAEVAYTMNLLHDLGCEIQHSCGGHIHVSKDSDDISSRFMSKFGYLEETAYAFCGAWYRYRNGNYAARIKSSSGILNMAKVNGASTDKYTAIHNHGNTWEFRYPSGTLSADQFVLNAGLIACVIDNHDNFPVKALEDLSPIPGGGYSGTGLHHSIMLGLSYLNEEYGWRRGGDWKNLLVDLNPVTFTVKSNRTDEPTPVKVELPTIESISGRIVRQLVRFYIRAGIYEEHIKQALGVLGFDYNLDERKLLDSKHEKPVDISRLKGSK